MNRSWKSNGRGCSSHLWLIIFIQHDNQYCSVVLPTFFLCQVLRHHIIACSNSQKKQKIRWNREQGFHQKSNVQKNSTINFFFCMYQTLQALFHLIFFFFFFYPFEDAMVSQDNSKLSRWMKMVGRKDDEWPLPLLSLDLFIKRYGSRFDFPPVLHRWYTFEHLEEEELLVCCAAGSNTTSAAFSQPPASMPFSSP